MSEGVILKSSDVNKALREYNKYWDAMYNKIYSSEQDALRQLGTSYSTQEYSLNKSYEEAVAEAYAASKGNRQQILSSDLGTGYKDALIASNQDALQKAYEQYKSNYLSGLSDIKSSFIITLVNLDILIASIILDKSSAIWKNVGADKLAATVCPTSTSFDITVPDTGDVIKA